MPSKKFQDLTVWQEAHKLVLSIYKYSGEFPRKEQYGLTSQLRRSAISVPANIAEGFKKKGKADKLRFMNIAQGSLEETRYYLILAKDLDYGDNDQIIDLLETVSRLLEGYIKGIIERMP